MDSTGSKRGGQYTCKWQREQCWQGLRGGAGEVVGIGHSKELQILGEGSGWGRAGDSLEPKCSESMWI